MYELADDTVDEQYMVAVGNPFEGITFYGPFQYLEDANDWAAIEDPAEDWWIVTLYAPREIDEED